ncbi:lactosylceramide 4-alpha-galactosyltransferase-like [Chironomus tepperi]|uniref:lactosylceramide 4-alpha-galactosyltransferase-like n=1 Tax=Chironomus tepperi TaxID=113505 RepID=UPI00391F889C
MRRTWYKISEKYSKIFWIFLLGLCIITLYKYRKSSVNVQSVQQHSQNAFNPAHKNDNDLLENSSEFDEIPLANRIINLNNITTDVLKPKNKRNVFFVFDSITDSRRRKKLNFREICSIESAVLKHPDHIIFIIYLTYDNIVELQITKSFYGLPYKNLRFGKLNVNQFIAETPWKDVDVYGNFKDISKLVRLLLLWKYGGIYVDSSMIIKESLKNLKNFLCSNDIGSTAYNVMEFDEKNIVEIFINNTLKDFTAGNSDILINTEKIVKNLCKNARTEYDRVICRGFKVMSKEFCYPISSNIHWQLFDVNYKGKIIMLIEKSAIINLWNEKYDMKKVDKVRQTAVAEIMKEYCPKTFGVVWKNEF